jgi:hypothetical protein
MGNKIFSGTPAEHSSLTIIAIEDLSTRHSKSCQNAGTNSQKSIENLCDFTAVGMMNSCMAVRAKSINILGRIEFKATESPLLLEADRNKVMGFDIALATSA